MGNTHKGRILVLDDCQEAAKALTAFLRDLGFEVEEAHNGTEALVVAESLDPDLAMLDVCLPGLDGFQVAKRLRGKKGLVLVATTALSSYSLPEESKVLFDHYMQKPLDYQAVENLLSMYRRD